MSECVVEHVCASKERKRGVCRTCKDYLKFDRKKSQSAVAIGRSNKQKGKKSEQKLLQHFLRQGFEARIIEGSGSLKKIKADADSDLRVTLYGSERKVENKKRVTFDRVRKLVGEGVLYITGFCYILNENNFYKIIKGEIEIPSIREVSDRNYSDIHKFFEQDHSDIVSLDQSYKDFMFCITPALFQEISEVKGENPVS